MVGGETAIINRVILQALRSRFTNGPEIGLLLHQANKGLGDLSVLLEQGKITPVIDRCYPLEQLSEAIRYFAEGRTRGKLVVTMA